MAAVNDFEVTASSETTIAIHDVVNTYSGTAQWPILI
jgi:hypothetical protein